MRGKHGASNFETNREEHLLAPQTSGYTFPVLAPTSNEVPFVTKTHALGRQAEAQRLKMLKKCPNSI